MGHDSKGTNPPQDGREQRGDRTALALLVAARQAFAEKGFAGASVRDIAKMAEVNPALVAYHFESKEKLYRRVIDEAMQALGQGLLAALAGPGTLVERMQRVAVAYFDYLVAERDFPRLVLRAALDGDPEMKRLGRQYLGPLMQALEGALGGQAALRLGTMVDLLLTWWGAAVVPFHYEPVLSEAFSTDLLSETTLELRRQHLQALVAVLMEPKA